MTFGGRDNRGPSIAELQRFIRERVPLTFMLSNGETIEGHLRWFDESAFQIVPDGQQPFTILRSAVLGYKRRDASGATKPKSQTQSSSKTQTQTAVTEPDTSSMPADIASLLALDAAPAAGPDESAKPVKTDDAGNK